MNESKCPNKVRGGGCGCPKSESRCRGWVREVREEFQAFLAQPGPDQGDRVLAAYRVVEEYPSWTVQEVLRRF